MTLYDYGTLYATQVVIYDTTLAYNRFSWLERRGSLRIKTTRVEALRLYHPWPLVTAYVELAQRGLAMSM